MLVSAVEVRAGLGRILGIRDSVYILHSHLLLRFPLPHRGMRVTPPHLTRGIEWQLRYHDIGMYVATTHTSTIHTSTDEISKMSGIFWNLWQLARNSPLKFNLMLGTIRLPKSGFKVLGSVASRMTITATILPTRVSSVIQPKLCLFRYFWDVLW